MVPVFVSSKSAVSFLNSHCTSLLFKAIWSEAHGIAFLWVHSKFSYIVYFPSRLKISHLFAISRPGSTQTRFKRCYPSRKLREFSRENFDWAYSWFILSRGFYRLSHDIGFILTKFEDKAFSIVPLVNLFRTRKQVLECTNNWPNLLFWLTTFKTCPLSHKQANPSFLSSINF